MVMLHIARIFVGVAVHEIDELIVGALEIDLRRFILIDLPATLHPRWY